MQLTVKKLFNLAALLLVAFYSSFVFAGTHNKNFDSQGAAHDEFVRLQTINNCSGSKLTYARYFPHYKYTVNCQSGEYIWHLFFPSHDTNNFGDDGNPLPESNPETNPDESDSQNSGIENQAPDISSCTAEYIEYPYTDAVPFGTDGSNSPISTSDGCQYEYDGGDWSCEGERNDPESTCNISVDPSGTTSPPQTCDGIFCGFPSDPPSSSNESCKTFEQEITIDQVRNTPNLYITNEYESCPDYIINYRYYQGDTMCYHTVTIEPDGNYFDQILGGDSPCFATGDPTPIQENPPAGPSDGGTDGGGSSGGSDGGGSDGSTDGSTDGSGSSGGTGGTSGGGGDVTTDSGTSSGGSSDGSTDGSIDSSTDGSGPGDCSDEPDKCTLLERIADALDFSDDDGVVDSTQSQFDSDSIAVIDGINSISDDDLSISGFTVSALISDFFAIPSSPQIRDNFEFTAPEFSFGGFVLLPAFTFKIEDGYNTLRPFRELTAFGLYLFTLGYLLYLFLNVKKE